MNDTSVKSQAVQTISHFETDEERAQRVVRAVFMDDLKGEVGHLARRSVPLSDRQDIARRLVKEFREIRQQMRAEYLV